MTKYARIDQGKVAEILDLPDTIDIESTFSPEVTETLHECGDDVIVGWVFQNGSFAAPQSVAPTKAELTAYAAAKRYAVETAGITVNGMSVLTDRQSQALITGAYAYVQANPDVTVKFKTPGGFVDLAAAEVTTVSNAVGAHVQASFAAEDAVVQGITGGTVTTTVEIDAASWPA